MPCKQDKEQIIPGRPTKHQLQTVPDRQGFHLPLFDSATVQSNMHSVETMLYILNFDLFSG